MGGKLSKKGFNMAYEKPIAQKVEEEAATVKLKGSEEVHPVAESVGLTTEKKDQDSQVPADDTEGKEGGGVPEMGLNETCEPEPKQLDLVPNEEQLVATANEEITKSSEADPSQLLEETATTGVERTQEGNAE